MQRRKTRRVLTIFQNLTQGQSADEWIKDKDQEHSFQVFHKFRGMMNLRNETLIQNLSYCNRSDQIGKSLQ